MRIIFLAAAAAVLVCQPVSAAPRTECKSQALKDLNRLSPQGHDVYVAVTDKKFFTRWITCDDTQLGLATAVHETVHLLTEEKDAFPLIGGGSVKRVHDVSRLYPPREIAARFNSGSTYVQTYLRPGAASSSSDFMYLLDELNAYTHDLNSAVKLQPLHKGGGQVDHRDGLAALMAFMTGYVDTAKRQKPATWQGLQRPETKHVIQTLWNQAETVLASSCGIPGIGQEDRKFIGFMCDPNHNGALGEILGRPTVCVSACLDPGPTSSSGTSATR